MLEDIDQRKFELMLAHLKCGVAIPENWTGFHSRRGPLPPVASDVRRFPRVHWVGDAVCEIDSTLPSIKRSHAFYRVCTKNVSRGGVAFLLTFQLYPREEAILWTGRGKMRCRVERCRKHNDRCFEIGAAFDEPQALPVDPYTSVQR